MPKPNRQSARPSAIVVERTPFAPPQGAPELARALNDDIVETLGAMPVRVRTEPIAEVYANADAPLIVTFSDVPALPWLSVEGALEELDEIDVVIGPVADGSLYLVGLQPGLPGAVLQALGSLEALTDVLAEHEIACTVLPPWFRVATAADLTFAENLARLSLLGDHGADDFLADRLRIWFEKFDVQSP